MIEDSLSNICEEVVILCVITALINAMVRVKHFAPRHVLVPVPEIAAEAAVETAAVVAAAAVTHAWAVARVRARVRAAAGVHNPATVVAGPVKDPVKEDAVGVQDVPGRAAGDAAVAAIHAWAAVRVRARGHARAVAHKAAMAAVIPVREVVKEIARAPAVIHA